MGRGHQCLSIVSGFLRQDVVRYWIDGINQRRGKSMLKACQARRANTVSTLGGCWLSWLKHTTVNEEGRNGQLIGSSVCAVRLNSFIDSALIGGPCQ